MSKPASPETAPITGAEAATIKGVPLACPRDRGVLIAADDGALSCACCGTRYPVVNGLPVLINDDASAFAIADYLPQGRAYEGAVYATEVDRASGFRRRWRRWMGRLIDTPSSIRHPRAAEALRHVRLACAPRVPRTLVVGSGTRVVGGAEDIVIQTDVALAPGVHAIADAHDLPFPDGSFDLVVAIAVLEHVADPQRCVTEFRRVLAPGGHVYAATPFLQPVHMGAYDFTRFTPIGHRRLFRHFDEVAAGTSIGLGSVSVWILGALLAALTPWRPWKLAIKAFEALLTPLFRWLDKWLTHDVIAAGGVWFLGRLRDGAPVTDRELVGFYRLPRNPPMPWRSPLEDQAGPSPRDTGQNEAGIAPVLLTPRKFHPGSYVSIGAQTGPRGIE